jgi:hypothetical protein
MVVSLDKESVHKKYSHENDVDHASALNGSHKLKLKTELCRLVPYKGIETRLWAGRPRNRGTIPVRSKVLFSLYDPDRF